MRRVRKPLAEALQRAANAKGPDLSLAALLAAVDGAAKANKAARLKQNRAANKRAVPVLARNRAKRVKAGVVAKTRERVANGRVFRGASQRRHGLLPAWADTLADAPDGPFRPEGPNVVRHSLMRQGWLQHASGVVRRHDLPPINKTSGVHARGPQTYVLTDGGRVVRAWLQWVRARRAMGWPCPMFGKGGAFVRYWIVGDPVPVPKWGAKTAFAGYLPGDAADEACPWLWEGGCGPESGPSGM